MKRLSTTFFVFLLTACIFSGCHSHNWKDATCTEPPTCASCGETLGEPLKHDYESATCDAPSTCKNCGDTQGEPLSHEWREATCSSPKYCFNCDATEGFPLDHEWVEATDTTPKTCSICQKMEAMPLPENGKVFIRPYSGGSKLTIKSGPSKATYVKLKKEDGTDVFSFFIRADEEASAAVPRGKFYIYFATGTEWYGTEHHFGSSTTYTKVDEICDFSTYEYTYELDKPYGNTSPTDVADSDF